METRKLKSSDTVTENKRLKGLQRILHMVSNIIAYRMNEWTFKMHFQTPQFWEILKRINAQFIEFL